MSTKNENPLLAKLKMPGRIFQLPSRCVMYNNGEVDPEAKGEFHVMPLSAMAEIKLKSPDMLFSGRGVIETISECVPEIKDPGNLFCKDVDAILCFIRVVAYGQMYSLAAKHDCDTGEEHNYDIDIEQVIRDMVFINENWEDEFKTVTPQGQTVILRPLRFNDAITLMQAGDFDLENITAKKVQDQTASNLLMMIESVDGVTDKGFIDEWVRSIPPATMARISDAIQKTSYWGPNLTSKLKCIDCGEVLDLDIPINPASFFSV